jgi:UDP-N-acetylmuramoyl-tripeptide--D-alanyl-D-alanine ligase
MTDPEVTALGGVVVGACSAAALVAGIRWLRVAQREHYLPGSVSRFGIRWWNQDPVSRAGAVVAVAGAVLAFWWPAAGLVTAVVAAAGPPRLGLRGRTSPLTWTRRLKTLAAVTAGLAAVAVVVAVVTAGVTGAGPLVAAAVALLVPLLVDLGCAITGPFERAAASTHVRRAGERLRRVGPAVVAITGSYGKTGTKGYVTHLLAGSKTVVASPASFNNRAGLARAVNENLADQTEVFVAEMGTYGPGEIAELCSWLVPDIAVITAIGPVHLERFGTEDRIVEAKAEILEGATTAVLNIDDPRLAALADRFEEDGGRVRRVSATDPGADVSVRADPGGGGGLTLFVDGAEVAGVPEGTRPGNVACAVAVALETGIPVGEIARRVGSLPTTAHRLEATVAAGGFVVLDDTYNANPAGARAALSELDRSAPAPAHRVVVTPGMVELGPVQAEENTAFARAVAEVADVLIVVGRTNRAALLAGAGSVGEGGRPGALRLVVVDRRDQAVAWVRDHLGAGDAVLYENDLPDHYP